MAQLGGGVTTLLHRLSVGRMPGAHLTMRSSGRGRPPSRRVREANLRQREAAGCPLARKGELVANLSAKHSSHPLFG